MEVLVGYRSGLKAFEVVNHFTKIGPTVARLEAIMPA